MLPGLVSCSRASANFASRPEARPRAMATPDFSDAYGAAMDVGIAASALMAVWPYLDLCWPKGIVRMDASRPFFGCVPVTLATTYRRNSPGETPTPSSPASLLPDQSTRSGPGSTGKLCPARQMPEICSEMRRVTPRQDSAMAARAHSLAGASVSGNLHRQAPVIFRQRSLEDLFLSSSPVPIGC